MVNKEVFLLFASGFRKFNTHSVLQSKQLIATGRNIGWEWGSTARNSVFTTVRKKQTAHVMDDWTASTLHRQEAFNRGKKRSTISRSGQPCHLCSLGKREPRGRSVSEVSSCAGPSSGFSSRGGQKPDGGAKNQKGGHIFKILYWMYGATRGPNVKWRAQTANGGPGTTGPPAGDGPDPV